MKQARCRRHRRGNVLLGCRIRKIERLESLGLKVALFLTILLPRYIW